MISFQPKLRQRSGGFTITELLIALGILGVIATFTIPKLLNSQSTSAWNAQAKEIVKMVSQNYMQYKFETGIEVGNVQAAYSTNFTQFMNYVNVDTTSTIDHITGLTSLDCSDTANRRCIKMHSGGVLSMPRYNHFGVADPDHFVMIFYDPDGVYSGSTTGEGKSVVFDLHYDGAIFTSDQRVAIHDTFLWGSDPGWGADPLPDWFSW